MWMLGFLIGAAWSAINFILIFAILRISILEQPKKSLFAILLIKFPVLYLAGFLILSSGIFPISGIMAGLTAVLLLVGAIKLWPKRT